MDWKLFDVSKCKKFKSLEVNIKQDGASDK